MQNNQTIILLGGLVIAAAVLAASEYALLLIYPDLIYHIPEKILSRLDQIMPIIRLGTPLLYLIFCFCWVNTKTHQDQPRRALLRWPLILITLSCLWLIGDLPRRSLWWLRYGYPAALGVIGMIGPLLAQSFRPNKHWGIANPKHKKSGEYGFNFRLHNGWINILNPFRGILLIAGPGSGKTYSFFEPIINQAAQKGYTGILYDFKFPSLTEHAYRAFSDYKKGIDFYVVNFVDLNRSHRVNPLAPDHIPNLSYAIEYAQTIITNLNPETIGRQDFWSRSSISLLSAVIWYLKKHHPQYCSLPHVVALICSPNHSHLIQLLGQDRETAGLVASIDLALKEEAGRQVAGVVGSLQNSLARINIPEIAWVMSGDDFSLDINNPKDKKFVVIGNDPRLTEALAPAISLIMTAALKLMNIPNRHHSIVLMDEGPSIYIPKLELIPATARSNKVAMVFAAQDMSQLIKMYGKTNADVITGTLSTHIFGKVSHVGTAEHVSRMFGKQEREVSTIHESTSFQKTQKSVSYQTRETQLVKPQEVIGLSEGEFIGAIAGKKTQWFAGRIIRRKRKRPKRLPAFASGIDIHANFERIHHEVQGILK